MEDGYLVLYYCEYVYMFPSGVCTRGQGPGMKLSQRSQVSTARDLGPSSIALSTHKHEILANHSGPLVQCTPARYSRLSLISLIASPHSSERGNYVQTHNQNDKFRRRSLLYLSPAWNSEQGPDIRLYRRETDIRVGTAPASR